MQLNSPAACLYYVYSVPCSIDLIRYLTHDNYNNYTHSLSEENLVYIQAATCIIEVFLDLNETLLLPIIVMTTMALLCACKYQTINRPYSHVCHDVRYLQNNALKLISLYMEFC